MRVIINIEVSDREFEHAEIHSVVLAEAINSTISKLRDPITGPPIMLPEEVVVHIEEEPPIYACYGSARS